MAHVAEAELSLSLSFTFRLQIPSPPPPARCVPIKVLTNEAFKFFAAKLKLDLFTYHVFFSELPNFLCIKLFALVGANEFSRFSLYFNCGPVQLYVANSVLLTTANAHVAFGHTA